jgi:hypothetical protein
MNFPSIEDLMKQAEYKQHPFGQVWQPFDSEAFQELASNIDRRGQDKEIMLYQDMILEGWHRYLACLAAKITPRFVEFKGSDLEAAELVHASGVRRHSSADQRYASFLMLCEACPAFKEKYEQLREKGEQQQQAGKPLATSSQRVNVVETKAKAAGVSKATAKKVERIKKEKPGAVADIAAGKTTANKELDKLPKSAKQAKNRSRKPPEVEEVDPDEFTAQVAGVRSFIVVDLESGYDVASVIHLLQIGQGSVKDDIVYLGDKKIAWLEMKDDQLEYSDFHIVPNEPLEQIATLPSEAAATPVLCLHDPGREAVTVEDCPSETQTQAISLEFDQT